MPRVWTRKLLRELAARRMAGESTSSIAASVGVTANNLRHRWRKHIGFRARVVYFSATSVSNRTMRVWGWLQSGISLTECCRRLGWDADQRALNRLSMALRRYCERNGISLPEPTRRRVNAHAPRQAPQ